MTVMRNSTICRKIIAGIETAPADPLSEEYGCGNMLLSSIDSGDFVMLQR